MGHLIRNCLNGYEKLDERRGIGSLTVAQFQTIHPGLEVAHEGSHMITDIRSVTVKPDRTEIEVYLVKIER